VLLQTRSRDGSLKEIRFLLPPVSVGGGAVKPAAASSAGQWLGTSGAVTVERLRTLPIIKHVSNTFADVFQFT
jgi:hypothetical protein